MKFRQIVCLVVEAIGRGSEFGLLVLAAASPGLLLAARGTFIDIADHLGFDATAYPYYVRQMATLPRSVFLVGWALAAAAIFGTYALEVRFVRPSPGSLGAGAAVRVAGLVALATAGCLTVVFLVYFWVEPRFYIPMSALPKILKHGAN